LHLGYIFEVEHRLEDARRRYQHAADLRRSAPRQEPKDYLLVQALVGLGRIALAEGKVAEAVSSLEKARGIEPAHQEALAAIAAAYARAGRKNDAANASAGVGDLEGRSGFPDPLVTSVYAEGASYAVLESVGLAALRAQAYGEVLAIFDRAIAIRPDDPDALLARAQALLGLNRPADAEPLLDRVLDKRPGNVSALMFRGGCSMARNDFAGAVHFLKRALAIDPTRSGARLNLSKAHRGLRQPAEARPHVEFLLQRMPHNSAFRLELAHLLVDEGKPTEALSEVERVLGAEPSNQQALALKAKLAP
jgi:Tfp pilus assembly protein PilF